MTWTNTSAFSDYIRTQVHGDETVLRGAHRPDKDNIEITPGGIVIPIFVSGTVEDVSTTASTSTPNNTLKTLTDANKRRVDHLLKTQWNRFKDSRAYREGIAMNQAQDLLGNALTAFYNEMVDNGTKIAQAAAPTGQQITDNLLTQMAKIKSRSPKGIPSQMSIVLNESGGAAFASNQAGKFNYAPATDPFYGTWMGSTVWTTNDALSGSGTVYGFVFGELGIAYVSADVDTQFPINDMPEPRTGMWIVSTVHCRSLATLDAELVYWLTHAG